ncbi:hypothetical protein [Dactylosporangium sp. CA-139066]|uniref:hypothetical protein n=1 Tax=Dactylosporangium sp. CA-139066 TaxID=3239930 RepID=UPI003D8C267C
MARIGQLFGGRGATDRDGDGVDDRAERRVDLDRDGVDDRAERRVDLDRDGVDDRAERRVDLDRDGVDDRAERPVDLDRKGVDDRNERVVDRNERVADRDRDGVNDRAEAASETRTWRLGRRHNEDAAREPATTGTVPAAVVMDRDRDTTTMRRTIDREPSTPPPALEPAEVTEPVPVRQAPARVSLLATLGLILGVAGVGAALTGLLAPWAIALGALGLLFSFGGIIAGVRPNVAGRGLGTLGVLISGTAVVFAILAMTGQVSWLDSHTDQVARLNDWLDAKLPWMKDW